MPRAGARLPDRVGPRLRVLLVGINPGLRSAAVGHHFAGPSNRFWTLLHESGLIADRLTFRDDRSLPGIGLGLTNLVSRPTAGSADLNRDDFVRGERILRRKVRRLRPRIVAFVGVTLVRALEGARGHRLPRRIRLGEVSGRFEDVPFVVLPNPSGRNASIPYARMLRAYRRLAGLSGAGRPLRRSFALTADGEPKRAVLFDFDGVLAQTERFHFRAFREILAPLGIRLTRTLYDRRYLAFDDRTALETMLRDSGGSLPRAALADLVRRKRRIYARLCGSHLKIGRQAAGLLRAVSRRVPVAIVSGAARDEIVTALRRGRVDGVVETIVAAEDVRRCKPDPEGYRLALDRLGISRPDNSVAVEDAPGGVRAARAAGLKVIGIASTYRSSVLRSAGASMVVRSIDRVAPGDLIGS